MKVCVLGIWHLGAVASACLADLGFEVVGVDEDAARVEELNRGHAPLFEPGLDDRLAKGLAAGRLRFVTGASEGVAGADYVLIAYDTPVDERDEVDLSGLFAAAQAAAAHLKEGCTIVVSSQVPVGTCERLAGAIREANPAAEFGIACVPENLRLGQAIQRFTAPDFLVFGAADAGTHERLEELFSGIETPKLRTDLRTAEMTKHAINAYLATSISFINEIANLCDLVGAEGFQVAEALRLDSRTGSGTPLRPGLAFGGGTLARDMKALLALGLKHGYEPLLIGGAALVNERQNGTVLARLKSVCKTLRGLTIGVLGLTYKPGTSTIRRSPAVAIIQALSAEGAAVKAYDPKADQAEVRPYNHLFARYDNAYAVADGCQALILTTGWPQFKELDFRRIRDLMWTPRLLLDAQNMLDADEMSHLGFLYQGIGRSRAPRGRR